MSRRKAASRAFLWGAFAVGLGGSVILVFGRLHFRPSGVSNRVVDYSIAVVMLPVLLVSAWGAIRALRWLALCLWPGRLGVRAESASLELFLGPFGRRRYDSANLEVLYLFELEDDDSASFEAMLPEEEQEARFLPRIVCSDEPGVLLSEVMLKFIDEPEEEAAKLLRPVIRNWRKQAGDRKHAS